MSKIYSAGIERAGYCHYGVVKEKTSSGWVPAWRSCVAYGNRQAAQASADKALLEMLTSLPSSVVG